MFTGIIRALGTVTALDKKGGGRTLQIDLGGIAGEEIFIGDSIAVAGVCLTVSEKRDGSAVFSVSPETLMRCLIHEWKVGKKVNLEPALTAAEPLGGHLVAGHIDGVGGVIAIHEDDAFTRMEVETTKALGRLIADKGSIAVDGVSLTVNDVSDQADGTRFSVMLVPHTLKHTTLGAMRPGMRAHLEVDLLARYVQRLLQTRELS